MARSGAGEGEVILGRLLSVPQRSGQVALGIGKKTVRWNVNKLLLLWLLPAVGCTFAGRQVEHSVLCARDGAVLDGTHMTLETFMYALCPLLDSRDTHVFGVTRGDGNVLHPSELALKWACDAHQHLQLRHVDPTISADAAAPTPTVDSADSSRHVDHRVELGYDSVNLDGSNMSLEEFMYTLHGLGISGLAHLFTISWLGGDIVMPLPGLALIWACEANENLDCYIGAGSVVTAIPPRTGPSELASDARDVHQKEQHAPTTPCSEVCRREARPATPEER